MEKVRLGVIGMGNMGSEHVRILSRGGAQELTICCAADLRPERREWFRSVLPETPVFADGRELLDARLCDAVLIAVPHPLHPEMTIAALEKGCHTLCEKPIAVTVSDARRMIAAANRTDRTFALMFNQRTNCLYRKMKETLDSGALGPVRRVTWICTDWYRSQRYYDSGSWRATWLGEGGGVLLNQCPHQLDLL